jgi:hypothetical protein
MMKGNHRAREKTIAAVKSRPESKQGQQESNQSSSTTRIDWENAIARNIVAMYASTVLAQSDLIVNGEQRSRAILGYVKGKDADFAERDGPLSLKELNIVDQGKDNARNSAETSSSSPIRSLIKDNHIHQKTSSSIDDPNRLPIISKATKKVDAPFRRCLIVRQRDGTQKLIRSPPIVSPIWFVSAGDVRVNWEGLPLHESLQLQLDYLFEQKHYQDYLRLVEKILQETCMRQKLAMQTTSSSLDDQFSNFTILILSLWKQLISTANAFAILSIEQLHFDIAHDVLTSALSWIQNEIGFLTTYDRRSLKAHVHNTFAFYFYKRNGYASSSSHTLKALDYHELCGDVEGVVKTLLDLSCVQISTSKFKDAHKVSDCYYVSQAVYHD